MPESTALSENLKVEWLGHASFLLSFGDLKLVTDPYDPQVGYGNLNVPANVVTVSHEHFDHNHVAGVTGNPQVFRGLEWKGGPKQVGSLTINTIPTFHDASNGSQRGKNAIFIMEWKDMKVVHLGDLGHVLTADQVSIIGKVDVLLIPVGGFYTIDAAQATQIVEQLKPKITIPMHYKTEANKDWPISPVDEFLAGKTGVKHIGSSSTAISKSELPTTPEIWVLAPPIRKNA